MLCVMTTASPTTVRVANAVEQRRRVPVVDVTEHGDDSTAQFEQRLVFFVAVVAEQGEELDLLLAARFDERHGGAERLGDVEATSSR